MGAFFLLIRFAWRNVIRQRRRTFIATMTVALGAFALTAFHGFNHGILTDYRVKTIKGQMGNGQIFPKGYRGQVFPNPVDHWLQNTENLQKALQNIPEVAGVFPRVKFTGILVNGDINVTAIGEGIDGQAEAKFFDALAFRSGQTFTTEEDGLILGEILAQALHVKVGDSVTILGNNAWGMINGVKAKVTGIYWTGEQNFDSTRFRIQLKNAQKLLETERVESFSIGLKDFAAWHKIKSLIATQFPELESLSFEEIDVVYYGHSVAWLNQQFSVILCILLTIIIFGVANTLAILVYERRRELATLRANGESQSDVFKLILSETAIMGIVGACVGIATMYLINATILRNGIWMPPTPGYTQSYSAFIRLEYTSSLKWLALTIAGALFGGLTALFQIRSTSIGRGLHGL